MELGVLDRIAREGLALRNEYNGAWRKQPGRVMGEFKGHSVSS